MGVFFSEEFRIHEPMLRNFSWTLCVRLPPAPGLCEDAPGSGQHLGREALAAALPPSRLHLLAWASRPV